MMARKSSAWTLVTPLAYRRPRRPGRRVVLIASGLAVSTVVAGLAVLGSIGPTQHAMPAPTPARRPSSATSTTASVVPATTEPVALPSGTRALTGYYSGTRPPTTTDGYVTPSTVPTTAPPPTITSETYTMTYPSGTIVVVYPGGGDRGGGRGGHH
jgi:hypothetical protein